MLFTRPPPDPSSLPNYLLEIHDVLASLLKPLLPSEGFDTAIKQSLARQAILNLYSPGEGITSHIDLPSRYADGIIGVSLTGGCTMTFTHEETERRHDVFVPARTVYVMCGEARWEWSHGIEGRVEDVVQVDGDRLETRLRSTRVSVTFRWMQTGADVLA
jgi:alkylated DNA repair dioxygenase AlkB